MRLILAILLRVLPSLAFAEDFEGCGKYYQEEYDIHLPPSRSYKITDHLFESNGKLYLIQNPKVYDFTKNAFYCITATITQSITLSRREDIPILKIWDDYVDEDYEKNTCQHSFKAVPAFNPLLINWKGNGVSITYEENTGYTVSTTGLAQCQSLVDTLNALKRLNFI